MPDTYNPLDEALRELRAIRSYWESREAFNNPPLTKGDVYRIKAVRITIDEIYCHLEAEGVANCKYYDENPPGEKREHNLDEQDDLETKIHEARELLDSLRTEPKSETPLLDELRDKMIEEGEISG